MGHVAAPSDSRVAQVHNILALLLWQRPMLAPLAEIRRLAQVVVEEQREELGRKAQDGLVAGEALALQLPGRLRASLWIPQPPPSSLPWIPTGFFLPRP